MGSTCSASQTKKLWTQTYSKMIVKETGIEGKVFVQFVVDSDGKLTNVQAVKGIGGGCDEEAVRVIKESLPWNPGLQQGEKVGVRMILPITFKLG